MNTIDVCEAIPNRGKSKSQVTLRCMFSKHALDAFGIQTHVVMPTDASFIVLGGN